MAGRGLGFAVRKWVAASSVNGPQADAIIDHPPAEGVWENTGLEGAWIEQDHIPFLLAPDPGGIAPRAGTFEFLVESPATPVQHSPQWSWSPGTPYPGPPARVNVYLDLDSVRWWGRTGQGKLVWSENTELTGDLPPLIPQDLVQHIDAFQRYWGGYPSMARNRPAAFGDQVPVLNPIANNYELSPG